MGEGRGKYGGEGGISLVAADDSCHRLQNSSKFEADHSYHYSRGRDDQVHM